MNIFHLKPNRPKNYLTKTPHYQVEKGLLLALARQFEKDELQRLWDELDRFRRHDILEQAIFKTPDGDLIVPTHIADKNFREMEKTTATKWEHDLSILFAAPAVDKLNLHNKSGRIKIAVPGVRLGLEIGGILDFFNTQGIPVDLEAVDKNIAASEQHLLNLEKRKERFGSTVTFHSNTDANVYFRDKVFDIVVLRNPGSPLDHEYLEWKQLIKTMVKTRPSIFILSTYEYDIEDQNILNDIGEKHPVKESRLFDAWLRQFGFFPRRLVQNSWLQYPYSPYMIVPDSNLEFTWPSDRYMALYTTQ